MDFERHASLWRDHHAPPIARELDRAQSARARHKARNLRQVTAVGVHFLAQHLDFLRSLGKEERATETEIQDGHLEPLLCGLERREYWILAERQGFQRPEMTKSKARHGTMRT